MRRTDGQPRQKVTVWLAFIARCDLGHRWTRLSGTTRGHRGVEYLTSEADEGAHQNDAGKREQPLHAKLDSVRTSLPLATVPQMSMPTYPTSDAHPLLLFSTSTPKATPPPPPLLRPPWSPSSRPTRCPTDLSSPPHARSPPNSLLSLPSSPSFLSQPTSCPHTTSPTSLPSACHPVANVQHVHHRRGQQGSGCPSHHQRRTRTSRSRKTRTSSSAWRAAQARANTGGISPPTNLSCTIASPALLHGGGHRPTTAQCATWMRQRS